MRLQARYTQPQLHGDNRGVRDNIGIIATLRDYDAYVIYP